MDTQNGVQPQQQHADSHVHAGKKAFEQACEDIAKAGRKAIEEYYNKNGQVPRIIEVHYAANNAEAEAPTWGERAWEKLCTILLVIICIPWFVWQFAKKPDEAHKLPFID